MGRGEPPRYRPPLSLRRLTLGVLLEVCFGRPLSTGWQTRSEKTRVGKRFGQLVRLGFALAGFAPAAYRRPSLERPFFCRQNGSLILGRVSRLDAFSAYPLPA